MGRRKGSKNKVDKGIYKNCIICSLTFRIGPSRENTAVVCGKLCWAKRHSKIISISQTGIKKSLESRLKIGQTLKNLFKDKTKHPGYKGLSTTIDFIKRSSNYKEWRLACFKRDNFTCIFCGDNKGGNLNVDHIKPFALIMFENEIKSFEEALNCKELWDINNGRTLCEDCHKKTDTYGSKTIKIIRYAKMLKI